MSAPSDVIDGSGAPAGRRPRVLFLMATRSYRAGAFMEATLEAGVEPVVGSDHRQLLGSLNPGAALYVDFGDPDGSTRAILEHARSYPLDAVIATEDDGAVLAARAAEALGLPHNPPDAVRAARFKDEAWRAFDGAGVPTPTATTHPADADPRRLAAETRFPCVLKPLHLAASRGVIRADDADAFVHAFRRIRSLLDAAPEAGRDPERGRRIMVQDYVAGTELALEGLLVDGRLHVLALFDKPDPLEGPYFEETLYITPSRHPERIRDDVIAAAAGAVHALGLRQGPVHAELRHDGRQAWVIEVAPRSIGGLCARVLRFRGPGTGHGKASGDSRRRGRDRHTGRDPANEDPETPSAAGTISLERLILEHALGRITEPPPRESAAAGVMMIPIPARGVLRQVDGLEQAAATEHVEDLVISIPIGQEVVPLPEGNRYLGFIFARAPGPDAVETALRAAHAELELVIE